MNASNNFEEVRLAIHSPEGGVVFAPNASFSKKECRRKQRSVSEIACDLVILASKAEGNKRIEISYIRFIGGQTVTLIVRYGAATFFEDKTTYFTNEQNRISELEHAEAIAIDFLLPNE